MLAGISVGNYIGSLIADKYPSRPTLGLILLVSGVFTVIILPLISIAGDVVSDMPLLPRIVTLTAVLFLPVSLILGMVTPIVIKLQLQELSRTGDIVGRFYAGSTAGSILGVFLTGFVLIQWIGPPDSLGCGHRLDRDGADVRRSMENSRQASKCAAGNGRGDRSFLQLHL